jgi:transcriptional antiterminator NusG
MNQTGEAPEPGSTDSEAGASNLQPAGAETVEGSASVADVGAPTPPAFASDSTEPEPDPPIAEQPAPDEPVAEESAPEQPTPEPPLPEEPTSEEPVAEPPVSQPETPPVPAEETGPEETVEASGTEGQGESEKPADAEEQPEEPKSEKMDWYILKVQSNREDSIREALWRRIKIAGMEQYFGDVIVPIEMVTEFKGGKRRVTKRKLYPGYLVIQMEINDDTWFLVRETPGIGDFTGAAGAPTPMLPHEVDRVLAKKEEKQDEAPKLKIGFQTGDRVKINDGTFENFEGEVDSIDETSGRVTVMINIFGRSTPVELEYWQVESV